MFEKIKQFFNPCRICKKRKRFELCDRYRYTSDDKNVIAWKEIVLPKES